MPAHDDERLFRNLSVYQDVVLGGRTVRRGARDCPARWELIAPVLRKCRNVLDVGSNFGWFGLKFCEMRREGVVASVEADRRSAAVQHRVLESHRHARICLLTQPASVRLAQTLERFGQRFDAALCLSVLHWIADHEAFLTRLGRLAGRLIVEFPDPREPDAGIEHVRREIGPIGPYLAHRFPDRPLRLLGKCRSHLQSSLPRELWLVEPPTGAPGEETNGLSVPAMLDLDVGWPPRSWWLQELERVAASIERRQADRAVKLAHDGFFRRRAADAFRLRFTHRGIEFEGGPCASSTLVAMRRRANRIPEHRPFSTARLLYRRGRAAVGSVLRAYS